MKRFETNADSGHVRLQELEYKLWHHHIWISNYVKYVNIWKELL